MANKYELRRRALKDSPSRGDDGELPRRGMRGGIRGETAPLPEYAPPPAMDRRGLTIGLCVGLVVLIAALFIQTAGHKFTVCDDNEYIYKNSNIWGGLTWRGIHWAFGDAHAGNWHPLTWISHMIDWEVFGYDTWEPENHRFHDSWPGGHHLVNVCLHCANAILLFLALRVMTGALWPCFVVAVLFAAHPLRAESVAWAAERKDVLCGLFWTASMLCYALYVRRPPIHKTSLFTSAAVAIIFGVVLGHLVLWPDPRDNSPTLCIVLATMAGAGIMLYAAATGVSWMTQLKEIGSYSLITLCLGLGLTAKSMIVTLPCIFILLDIWPLGRWRKALWPRGQKAQDPDYLRGLWLLVEKLPWLALVVGDCYIAVYGQQKGVAMNDLKGLPMPPRILNAVESYGEYLRQTFWPTGMAPFYAHPYMIPNGFTHEFWTKFGIYSVLLALVTAIAIVAMLKSFNWGWASLTAAWFCYLAVLLPIVVIFHGWSGFFDAPRVYNTLAFVLYGALVLTLGCLAAVGFIEKRHWSILLHGWSWYLCALSPVVVFLEGWNAVGSRLLFYGALLLLLSVLLATTFVKGRDLRWLTMIWYCYLGALVPLIGFLDRWHSLIIEQVVVYAVLLSPVIAAVIAALFKKRSFLFLAVGWFWYLGALMPVNGLAQVGTQARADRYTYLPMIGVYLMVAWLLKEVADRWKPLRPSLAAGGALLLVVMCAVTFRQVSYWSDSYNLFLHSVCLPEKDWFGYVGNTNNVDLEKAKSVVNVENNYFAFNHIGIAYDEDAQKSAPVDPMAAQQLFDHSAAAFQATLGIKPDYDFGNNNLGVYFARKNRPEDLAQAEKFFRAALRSNSRYGDAYNNLAIILMRQGEALLSQGKFEESISKLTESVQTHKVGMQVRGDPKASDHNNLCGVVILISHAHKALAEKAEQAHDTAKAAEEHKLQEAALKEALQVNDGVLEIDANFADSWIKRADIYRDLNMPDKEAESLERAIQIDPKTNQAVQALGRLIGHYDEAKNRDKALACLDKTSARFEQSLQGKPVTGEALNMSLALASNYANLNQKDKAVAWLDRTGEYLATAFAGRPLAETIEQRYKIAMFCMKLNQPDKAIPLLNQILAVNGALIQVLEMRGMAYEMKGDLPHAQADYDRVSRAPAPGQFAAAAICLDQQQPDRAIALLNQILAVNGATPQANLTQVYELRGNAFAMKHDLAGAKTDYETILRIAPQYPGIQAKIKAIDAELAKPH